LSACDLSAECRPVDDHDSRRNELTTIYGEKEALLHFGERNCAGGERTNDRGWPSTPAQGIQRVAALEDEHAKQKQDEGLPRSSGGSSR